MGSREASSGGAENCLDPRLWYACAGSMVQMPSVNSTVFYFPQGHSEHAFGNVDFRSCPRIPARIPCRVSAIKFMADRVTDEVFAKIRLVPISGNEMGFDGDDDKCTRLNVSENGDKHTSFAKTLTQSDANNGGGFSVPRYCAETIFPSLDYNNDPPVQTIVARDVHGETWKFRHIYRGTPRRHLLTTGWSIFVNHKSLVAGDSVVFMRGETSDVCLGIRRAKKGIGSGHGTPTWWNSASGGNSGTQCLEFAAFSGEGEAELSTRHGGFPKEGWTNRRRVKPEDVVQAATLAANGQAFDVIYYPRANTPEFCVKASQVIAALRIQWSPGMRFKMPFETEDSSRISWFMGTISSAQVADPIQWPDSPWRLLQVIWDEPDLLQNVRRVSPWLVELVPDIPSTLFSSPRKRLRSPHEEFPLDGKILLPSYSSHQVLSPNNLFGCLPPGGIQGARHAQYGFPTPYFHPSEQQPPSVCFKSLDCFSLPCQDLPSPVNVPIPDRDENVSCLLSIGNSAQESTKSDNSKPASAPFVLFGQPILTANQISQHCSSNDVPAANAAASPTRTSNVSSDKMGNTSGVLCSGFDLNQNKAPTSSSPSPCDGGGLASGLCKVFLESEDVGRTLDLFSVDCYDDLRSKLKDLFGIQVPETPNLLIYRDATGTVRQLGDEPFCAFVRSARRLTVLSDLTSNNHNNEAA